MNKHKENSIQTKQNLMDAFWALYCERGIEKITVREIAQKAGYNRGTFYVYFADVYDVLEQIENSLLPSIEDLPPLQFDATLPIDNFVKMYADHSKYYTVLLGEKGDPSFAAKLKSSVKSSLEAHFATAQAKSLELDYMLEFVLSAMIGVLTHWFQSEEKLPKEQLVALIYRLMTLGVVPELHKNFKNPN